MQVKFVMDTKSIKKVMNNLWAMLEQAKIDAGAELEGIGHYIMAESYAEAPFATGTMHDSGYVEHAKVSKDSVSVKIGYGGINDRQNPDTGLMASEYALIVHEDISKYHPYGKAHFLKDPVQRNVTTFNEKLAGRLATSFAKGVK